MATKNDFINFPLVFIIPKSILNGTASKEYIKKWRKDVKKGKWKKHYKNDLGLLYLLICLCATSCVTKKACDRKFPLNEKDSVTTVTNTVTVLRDTTIYITLAGDTVFKATNPGQGVNEISTPLAHSYAWVKDGKLQHRLEQKDTVVSCLLRDALKNTVTTSSSNRISYRVVTVNELTWWQKFWIAVGKIEAVFFVLCFLFFVGAERRGH